MRQWNETWRIVVEKLTDIVAVDTHYWSKSWQRYRWRRRLYSIFLSLLYITRSSSVSVRVWQTDRQHHNISESNEHVRRRSDGEPWPAGGRPGGLIVGGCMGRAQCSQLWLAEGRKDDVPVISPGARCRSMTKPAKIPLHLVMTSQALRDPHLSSVNPSPTTTIRRCPHF